MIDSIRSFYSELHARSLAIAAVVTALLALAITVGSRRLFDFDAALIGYCFASLFATFGIEIGRASCRERV